MPISVVLVGHDPSESIKITELANRLAAELGVPVSGSIEPPPVALRITQAGPTMEPSPPPTASLGRELVNPDDVRRWLSHPSNQKNTRLFIVGWDGTVPWISTHAVPDLAGDGFCWTVVGEQKRRKTRPTPGDAILPINEV